jgi:hypothetical protein
MRNLLAGLATLFILFALLGWGRSWYTVASQPAEEGQFAFRVDFDPWKVAGDITDGFRYIQSKLSKAKEEPAETK